MLRTAGRLLFLPIHLLTGVAGFWLSRSWRNASVFAGLWLILAALQRALDAIWWTWMSRDASVLEIPSSYIHLKAMYVAMALGLAVISLVCLIRRSRLPGPARLGNSVLSVALGLLAMAVTYREITDASGQVRLYLQQGGMDMFHKTENPERARIYRDVRFADSATWGDFVFLPYFRDGLIKGRILYDGKPLQARVKAYLDDHYRTPVARSDADGYFALEAPRGDWEINRISVSLESGPGMGDGLLLTVLDTDRKAPPFERNFFGDITYKGRLAAKSVAAPEREQLTLLVHRYMDVTWPVQGALRQPASRESTAIRWRPVSGAAEYKVTIFEETHGRDGLASARPILRRTVVQPELPLKALPTGKSPAPGVDYYVEVVAFSKEGELLTVSKSAFDKTTFIIEGGLSLVPEMASSDKCSE